MKKVHLVLAAAVLALTVTACTDKDSGKTETAIATEAVEETVREEMTEAVETEESGAEIETAEDTKAAAVTETKEQAESEVETEPETEPEIEPEIESETESETEPEAESAAEPETVVQQTAESELPETAAEVLQTEAFLEEYVGYGGPGEDYVEEDVFYEVPEYGSEELY